MYRISFHSFEVGFGPARQGAGAKGDWFSFLRGRLRAYSELSESDQSDLFSFLRGRLRAISYLTLYASNFCFHSFEVGFGLAPDPILVKSAISFSFLRGRLRAGNCWNRGMENFLVFIPSR